MSRWYRAYEGTVTDAKLGEAALVANCSRSVAIAAWHCILESCAAAQKGGEYDTTPRRVAVILGESIEVVTALFTAFAELGMLQDGAVTAWKQRQYESDTSTERSRKHRQRQRNGDATLQQRDATPPETETDTETETEIHTQEARVCESDPKHWAEAQDLLRDRTEDINDWELDFLHSIKWARTLSQAQADKLKAIRERLSTTTSGGFALPSVKRGTPAYDAWIAYYRTKGPTGFYEKLDALTVPTEFPPQVQAA